MCGKFMKKSVIVFIIVSLKDVFVAEKYVNCGGEEKKFYFGAESRVSVLPIVSYLVYIPCHGVNDHDGTFRIRPKITYMSVEHPHITYYSRKYLSYAKLTSVRYGRASPVYYVGLHFTTLYPLDNTYQAIFDFYEFLTNQYKPSFIQMKWNWCDLIHKDKFFGAALKQGRLDAPCPYPPGEYHLWNMTINPDVIPRGFPFTKGRIYCNITAVNPTTSKRDLVVASYIDMEIRQLKVANRIKNKKL